MRRSARGILRCTLLMLLAVHMTDTAAIPKWAERVLDYMQVNRDHLNPKPWFESACPEHKPPMWMIDAMVDQFTDRGPFFKKKEKGKCRSDQPVVPGVVSEQAPEGGKGQQRLTRGGSDYERAEEVEYETPAVQIDHVSVDELTPTRFYQQYFKLGLPVVVTGALDDEWSKKATALERCCAEEHAHKLKEHGEACQGCDKMTGHWSGMESQNRGADWTSHGVQMCGEDCKSIVSWMDTRGGLAPAGLLKLINFSAPLPTADDIVADASSPYVLWSGANDSFGGPLHFDEGCKGTLSMQLKGEKAWKLWAPFTLGKVEVHTRYETVLEEGELLFYGPAWYHGTKIERPPSVAAAYAIATIPYFGVVGTKSLWQSPMGWEACAAGKGGWRAQTAAWDAVLAANVDTAAEDKASQEL